MKYDAEEQSSRWLILTDKDQEFPTAKLEVESSEERKTASGKTMPVLHLIDPTSGDKYQICAWKRDVLRCVNEYGADTDSWDMVMFEKKNGRMQLVPAGMNVKEEKVNA